MPTKNNISENSDYIGYRQLIKTSFDQSILDNLLIRKVNNIVSIIPSYFEHHLQVVKVLHSDFCPSYIVFYIMP
jgi:hypothetical protein